MFSYLQKISVIFLVLISANLDLISQVYDVQPNVANCTPGVLSQAEKNLVLERVNFIRSLHKLKPVTWETAGDIMSMEGCLNIVASGVSGHIDDPSSECYTPGAGKARMKSNLHAGQSSAPDNTKSVDMIIGWLMDTKNADKDRDYMVGHRRAILNPFLTRFAYGRAEGMPKSGGSWNWVAGNFLYQDYTDGKIESSDLEYVAYPYEYYPPSYFEKSFYLSFNAIADKSNLWGNQNVSYANTTVEMKDENNNPMNVHDIKNDNEGWGSYPNNLSWKVDGLQDEVKYTVTIKNVNVKGTNKDYTYWFKLTSKNQTIKPNTPITLSPLNNSQNVKTNIALSWDLTTNTNYYILHLAKDPNFSSLIVNEKNLPMNGYMMKAGILQTKTTYYWRVAAKNDAGQSDWSPTWSFTTVGDKPSITSLVLPVNDATNISRTPTVSWNEAGGAESYSVQISKDAAFNPTSLKISKSQITETKYDVPAGRLDKNTKYWWRVKCYNSAGESDYSPVWTFTTNDEVFIPQQYEPANYSMNQPLETYLRWTTNLDASFYILNISTKEDFSVKTFEKNDLDINLFTVPKDVLSYNTKYFWRIKTVTQDNKESQWSNIWNFTTVNGSSVEEELLKSIQIYPNPATDCIYLGNLPVENVMVSIIDLNGNLVYINNVSNGTKINLKNLSNGIYNVILSNKSNSITKKIIVNK